MQIVETLKNLLPGVEISDDFVSKLTASIESVIAQRVDEETKMISEKANAYGQYVYDKAEEYSDYCKQQIDEITEKANAYSEYVVEEMTKKVEDYCEYVVEKFVSEQKERLIETTDYARMKNVLRSIREAFESNYYTLSDDPATVNLETKLEESRSAFNTLFEEHRELKSKIQEMEKEVDQQKKKSIFESLTSSLADTQKERLVRLIEKTNFSSIEMFEEGVKLMVQEIVAFDKNSSNKKSNIDESKMLINESKQAPTDRMKAYLERL